MDLQRAALEDLLGRDTDAAASRQAALFDECVAPLGGAVVLHGAGTLGTRVAERLRTNGVRVEAFSDADASRVGSVAAGVQVLSVAEAAGRYGRSAAFVITIWNPHHDVATTEALLRAAGCKRVVSCAALFYKFPGLFLPYYGLDVVGRVMEAADDVRSAFELLRDDASRRELLRLLSWTFHLAPPGRPSNRADEQYFVGEAAPRDDEVFVDCGAYDGDTLRRFLELRGNACRSAVAFEPDPESFARLEAWRARLPAPMAARLQIHRAAVGERCAELAFAAAGTSSHATTDGEIRVPCIALDEFRWQHTPTFIKMDIEGMELAALRGARSLLADAQPSLAVCAYHRLEHAWEVPLAIAASCPGHRLRLRSHGEFPFDLVCYAARDDLPLGR
jgi:FkbM family methyltransferase